MKRDETELGDGCPKCGAFSYQGGYCFHCDAYRPSKHNTRNEELNAATFMERNFGQRLQMFSGEVVFESDDDLYYRPIPQRIHKPLKTIAAPPRAPLSQPTLPTAPETSTPREPLQPAIIPRREKSLAEKIAEANFRYTQKPEGQRPPTIAMPRAPQRPYFEQHS